MAETKDRRIAVLGASDKEDRYAFKAVQRLSEKGYDVLPVNPALESVLGIPALPSLAAAGDGLDTVTVYLSAKRSSVLAEELVASKPERVILNPGAENPELEARLDQAGIPWMHACTLVLLSTGRF